MLTTIWRFLDERDTAILNKQLRDHAQASQDDFGSFDLDYEDPQLEAMLGIAEASTSDIDERDKEFAHVSLCLKRQTFILTHFAVHSWSIASLALHCSASSPLFTSSDRRREACLWWTTSRNAQHLLCKFGRAS